MSPTYLEILENFEKLPGNTLVPDSVTAILLNRTTRSLRRKSPIPKIKTGERTGGYRAADIRSLLQGQKAAA